MKRSLLLVSALLVCSFLISCQTKPTTPTTPGQRSTVDKQDSTNNENTSPDAVRTDVSGEAADTNKRRPTTQREDRDTARAIIHKSPEQEKIDSIKKAKTKDKKRSSN